MTKSEDQVLYQSVPADDHEPLANNGQHLRQSLLQRVTTALKSNLALILSCAVNVLFVVLFMLSDRKLPVSMSRSPYAGLINDVPTRLQWVTEYSDPSNLTLRDELWASDLSGHLNHALVALTHDESASLSLPPSEIPYILGSTTKGTYLLEAHYSLYCLQLTYVAIAKYRSGSPQTVSHEQVVQCLETLREGVICHADDTPRFLTKDGSHLGEGQIRMCRDFDKLDAWAKDRDACSHSSDEQGPGMSGAEGYKYCKREESQGWTR